MIGATSRHGVDPLDVVERLERAPSLPPGRGERFAGYGLMGQRLADGDILVLWRSAASSIGPAHTAVWHRNPDGRWTFYTDVEPRLAAARHFGGNGTREVVDTIALSWTGPRHLVVTVRGAGLVWSIELGATFSTRLLGVAARGLPAWSWRSDPALRSIGTIAGAMLGLGRVRLCGRTAAGHQFRLIPRRLWRVVTTRACVRGRDFGGLAAPAGQTRLGDLWLPARGVFAAGESCFASDPRTPG